MDKTTRDYILELREKLVCLEVEFEEKISKEFVDQRTLVRVMKDGEDILQVRKTGNKVPVLPENQKISRMIFWITYKARPIDRKLSNYRSWMFLENYSENPYDDFLKYCFDGYLREADTLEFFQSLTKKELIEIIKSEKGKISKEDSYKPAFTKSDKVNYIMNHFSNKQLDDLCSELKNYNDVDLIKMKLNNVKRLDLRKKLNVNGYAMDKLIELFIERFSKAEIGEYLIEKIGQRNLHEYYLYNLKDADLDNVIVNVSTKFAKKSWSGDLSKKDKKELSSIILSCFDVETIKKIIGEQKVYFLTEKGLNIIAAYQSEKLYYQFKHQIHKWKDESILHEYIKQFRIFGIYGYYKNDIIAKLFYDLKNKDLQEKNASDFLGNKYGVSESTFYNKFTIDVLDLQSIESILVERLLLGLFNRDYVQIFEQTSNLSILYDDLDKSAKRDLVQIMYNINGCLVNRNDQVHLFEDRKKFKVNIENLNETLIFLFDTIYFNDFDDRDDIIYEYSRFTRV
jgi:tRNA pseudouridine-54 N-methylase